jgi:hypothetical protein
MSPENKTGFPSRKKILWGFAKMIRYVMWLIGTNSQITNDEKKKLSSALRQILAVLRKRESEKQFRNQGAIS